MTPSPPRRGGGGCAVRSFGLQAGRPSLENRGKGAGGPFQVAPQGRIRYLVLRSAFPRTASCRAVPRAKRKGLGVAGRFAGAETETFPHGGTAGELGCRPSLRSGAEPTGSAVIRDSLRDSRPAPAECGEGGGRGLKFLQPVPITESCVVERRGECPCLQSRKPWASKRKSSSF